MFSVMKDVCRSNCISTSGKAIQHMLPSKDASKCYYWNLYTITDITNF